MSKWNSSLTTALPSPCPTKLSESKGKSSAKCGRLLSPNSRSRASPALDSAKGLKGTKPSGTIIELNLVSLSRQSHKVAHHKSFAPKAAKLADPSKLADKLRMAVKAREVKKLQIENSDKKCKTEQWAETYTSIEEQESGEKPGTDEETKEGVGVSGEMMKFGGMKMAHPMLMHGKSSESEANTDSSEKVNMVYRTEKCNGLALKKGLSGSFCKCKCQKDPRLPCCVRAVTWIKRMFDNKGTKFDLPKYREQYQNILKTETEDPSKNANCIQIKRDLNRTYPTCPYFSEGGTGQADMERVLMAYAKYDSQIGYVQGMNFIVGALLYHSSEEIAFWLFVTLIEDFEIRDIYLPGLPGLYKHTQIIDMLILQNLRTIYTHLCENEVKVEMFATNWIFTLFSSIVPIDEMANFFDAFFQDSWVFFYKFVIHMLRLSESAILASDEMAETISLIKNMSGARVDQRNSLLKSLFGGWGSEWEELITEGRKEPINEKCVKELLATYDTNSLSFKGVQK